MRAARASIALITVLATAAGGESLARASSASIARGLGADPVYVARGARPTLNVAQRGALRLRILRKDIGRISFAVVPSSEARRAGGVAALANGIDRRLRRRGSLVVVAGSSVYVVVSYPAAEGAAGVLRRAFASSHGSLAGALRRAVDGLARLDPGPGGDLGNAQSGAPATPPAISLDPFRKPLGLIKGVKDTFRWVGLIIAGAIALPFLIFALALLRRLWRRRADEGESLRWGRKQADEQLVALGDDIRSLDIDVSMPGADKAGVASYGQALESYEKAEQALSGAESTTRLREATGILADARRQMDAARAQLGRAQSPPPAAGEAPVSRPAGSAGDASSEAANRALGRP